LRLAPRPLPQEFSSGRANAAREQLLVQQQRRAGARGMRQTDRPHRSRDRTPITLAMKESSANDSESRIRANAQLVLCLGIAPVLRDSRVNVVPTFIQVGRSRWLAGTIHLRYEANFSGYAPAAVKGNPVFRIPSARPCESAVRAVIRRPEPTDQYAGPSLRRPLGIGPIHRFDSGTESEVGPS